MSQTPVSHRVPVCRTGWPRPGPHEPNNTRTVFRDRGYIFVFFLNLLSALTQYCNTETEISFLEHFVVRYFLVVPISTHLLWEVVPIFEQ